jgi:hypothetical protein
MAGELWSGAEKMPDGSSENLFSQVRAIGSEESGTWPGNDYVGKWNYRIAVSSWPMSVQPHGEDQIYDYFLVEFNGQASLGMRHDQLLKGYSLYMNFDVPLNPPYQKGIVKVFGVDTEYDITHASPPGLELIASSPDTSVASTSYSDGVSTTVGGSIGFFGDSMAGSVSASTTISNSTTRTVADLRIENHSGVEDNLTCEWYYEVSSDSLEAEGETPLLAQFLMRRPHSEDPFLVNLAVSAFFDNGGDPEGLGRHDWSDVDFTSGFESNDRQPTIYQNAARISKTHQVSISAPPAPKTGG